jgi:hypothetical protein
MKVRIVEGYINKINKKKINKKKINKKKINRIWEYKINERIKRKEKKVRGL